MKRTWMVAVVALLVPLALEAGAPPDGGRRERDGRERGGRERGGRDRGRRPGMAGRMPGGFFGQMGGGQGTDVFDVARRYFELNEEQQVGVRKLDVQHDGEEREALAALRKQLNTKYAPLIAALLPGEEKAKYEQVVAAMMARDEAIAAAQKDLLAALGKVRLAQGVDQRGPSGRVPRTKMELINGCLKLDQDQRGALGEAMREQRGEMRDKMRERMQEIGRPDRNDPAARQRFMVAFRTMREEMDNEMAKEIAQDVLSEAQKPLFKTASDALDVCNAKVKEAELTCLKKLVELLGEDKVPDAWRLKAPAKADAPAKAKAPAKPATEF